MSKIVGKISHYFDHVQAAALTLLAPLSVGDTVKISGHGQEVVQTVSSLQSNKVAIQSGKKGEDVAFKVDQPVKAGDTVELV